MAIQSPPIYIVSINKTPERAKALVAILIDSLEEHYHLVHAANTDTMFGVKTLLESLVIIPQVIICSSQWTANQQEEVLKLARMIIPGVKTIAIPPGLDAARGGDAVEDFLKEQMLSLGLPFRA